MTAPSGVTRTLHGVHTPLGAHPGKGNPRGGGGTPRHPVTGVKAQPSAPRRSHGAPEPVASRWLRQPPPPPKTWVLGPQGAPALTHVPAAAFFPAGLCLKVLRLRGERDGQNPVAPHGCSRFSGILGKGRSLQLSPKSQPWGGTGPTASKSPWKLYPRMQKTIGSAILCRFCLDLEGPPKEKTLKKTQLWVPQQRPKPHWDGERLGSECNRPREIPTEHLVESSPLLPTQFSTRDALGTWLRSKKSPPKSKGDGAGWMQVGSGHREIEAEPCGGLYAPLRPSTVTCPQYSG